MSKKDLKKTIKGILLNKKEGANKDMMKDLFRIRYGKEWQKYYPAH